LQVDPVYCNLSSIMPGLWQAACAGVILIFPESRKQVGFLTGRKYKHPKKQPAKNLNSSHSIMFKPSNLSIARFMVLKKRPNRDQ